MKKIGILLLLILSGRVSAQQNDSVRLQQMFAEIMNNGTCYDNLKYLTKNIGHRISGSEASGKAVDWGYEALVRAGADSVWKQPVLVPDWYRGQESLQFKSSGSSQFLPLNMISLGNSEGTNGKILEREIICFNNLDEFDLADRKDIEGKIVFFNYQFHQDWYATFRGYGDAVKYRSVALNKAARKGADGVIIRSVGTGMHDAPHTGMVRYEEGVRKIPSLALGLRSADLLAAACREGSVTVRLRSECTMKDAVLSYNVIGEIRGSEYPDRFILAGAHLDSWDVGEGAHDDGAGCVQSIEIIRTFRALNIRPRHTIRIVLFMNEENGVKGGLAYADSARTNNERHLVAIESDAGGFSPRGIGLVMPEELRQKVQSWSGLFLPYGVYDFSQEEGGVDISPLGRQGVPLAGLMPDQQRYFDYHHNAQDVFEAVSHRELKIGAWTMAAFVYLWDQKM